MRMKHAFGGLLFGSLFLNSLFLSGCAAGSESGSAQEADTVICDLQVEYRENPIGIDEERPVFSWKMDSDIRGQKQTAYRLMVADSPENLEKEELIWDSGRLESDISVAVAYEGETLEAASRYYWTVQVWDKDGKALTYGEDAFFETGLMDSGWSGAEWISAPVRESMAEFSPEECAYSISYEVSAEEATAGFIFGADTDTYGEYYVWALNREGEDVFLRTFRMDGYMRREEQVVPLAGIVSPEQLAAGVLVEIDVDQTKAVTFIDGQQAAETVLYRAKPAGRIGLFNVRTEEAAFIDNILVKDPAGNVWYQEDFSAEDTIFSPEYLQIAEGKGRIRSGILLVPGDDGPAPMLRREWELQDKKVASARLYASALGIYHLYVNGQAVTDAFFEPGQTVYDKELTYCTYDVTALLQDGENALGAVLGHGWFDRGVGYENAWNPWGSCGTAFLGKLVVTYEDGSQDVIVTDEGWQVYTDGPIRRDDMYQGEFYDARFEVEKFSQAGFEAEDWDQPCVNAVDEKFLQLPITAHARESVRQAYVMQPAAVTQPKEGVYVYDFGQEFTGVCRIKVKGKAGQCITLRYAEALNTENLRNRDDAVGTVWTQNLLTAANTDYYICKGSESETYTPSMVCRGFRYVQISGLEEGMELESVEGLVLMSSLDETGGFECSDPFVTRLYHNILWSQRSNFTDTPTDCPQRDERFGWAGDIGQFSSTAVYNMNARNFLQNYLEGMRLQQRDSGAYPDMVPHTDNQGFGRNGWGDAGVVITWELYRQYADLSVIEDNFDAMCAWVDYLAAESEDFVRRNPESYGDHLQGSSTSREMTDTAQSAYSALLLSRMAGILGKEQEQAHYLEVYENFKKGWQREWLLEDGTIKEGTQSAYALALEYELYPEELRHVGEQWLAICVEFVDAHPMTGYVGTPRILQALAESGRTDLAYRMLLQRTAPSWNSDIILGATTTAESWSSYVPFEDGTYELHGSLNHFALGSVGEWFYSGILGISPAEDVPGFQRILLKPRISQQLSYAQGSYESVYGTIMVKWEHTEKGYHYTVTIPANTSAQLALPVAEEQTVREGMAEILDSTGNMPGDFGAGAAEITVTGLKDGELQMELESGSYDFWIENTGQQ